MRNILSFRKIFSKTLLLLSVQTWNSADSYWPWLDITKCRSDALSEPKGFRVLSHICIWRLHTQIQINSPFTTGLFCLKAMRFNACNNNVFYTPTDLKGAQKCAVTSSALQTLLTKTDYLLYAILIVSITLFLFAISLLGNSIRVS